MALHPAAVFGGAAEIAAQYPVRSQQAAGLRAVVGLSLSDSDVGTDEGVPSQHRLGHVHPEQEL